MDKKPNVLLVCSNDGFQNLLRIPLILHEAGCNVTLLTVQNNLLARSRFVNFVLPPESDIRSLIIALKTHLSGKQGHYAWVLIGDESPLFEIIKYREESWLEDWFPVDVRSDAMEIISSKDGFVKACVTHGVPYPTTQVSSCINHALSAAEYIGYPVMLKTTRGSSGIGVRFAKNPDELLNAFKSVGSPPKFVLQKYVSGYVGVTEILMDHGNPLAWISSYKYQTLNGPFGPSCVRQFMTHSTMETIIRQIGEMTKFHGLCGFDWIHDKNKDSISVIEFHARPHSGFHLGKVCNVNFADGIRDMLSGKKTLRRPVVPPSAAGPKRAYMFPQHISRCIKERDFKDLIHWIPGVKANCHYDILLGDPGLLKSIIFQCTLNKFINLFIRSFKSIIFSRKEKT